MESSKGLVEAQHSLVVLGLVGRTKEPTTSMSFRVSTFCF